MSATPMALDAARMLAAHRWAALATHGGGGPHGSMVAYAAEPDLAGLVVFLSGLAEHTRNLLIEPRLSLVISEQDPGTGDPQTLARVTVDGIADELGRSSPGFDGVWRTYVGRLPEAAPRMMLGDFVLFRIAIARVRYVGGFARAATIRPADLSAAAEALEL